MASLFLTLAFLRKLPNFTTLPVSRKLTIVIYSAEWASAVWNCSCSKLNNSIFCLFRAFVLFTGRKTFLFTHLISNTNMECLKVGMDLSKAIRQERWTRKKLRIWWKSLTKEKKTKTWRKQGQYQDRAFAKSSQTYCLNFVGLIDSSESRLVSIKTSYSSDSMHSLLQFPMHACTKICN